MVSLDVPVGGAYSLCFGPALNKVCLTLGVPSSKLHLHPSCASSDPVLSPVLCDPTDQPLDCKVIAPADLLPKLNSLVLRW